MNTHTPQRGFTLVEMIVSIGIFIIVLFIATSAFLSVVNADRRSYATRVAIDNLTVALEDMTRRIKTGGEYSCGGVALISNCVGSPEGSLAFNDQDGRRTTYAFDSIDHKIVRTLDGSTLAVTPPEIIINTLSFEVGGTGDDTEQPYVRIRIGGTTEGGITALPFQLQTTVTQRAYDLY